MPARVPESDDTLKRERAGTYRTRDGRFTIEGSSSGWLLFDAEQTDDLGLPLARGPFATLDEAKSAIGPARSGPAPTSDIGRRPSPGLAAGRKGSRPSSKHDGTASAEEPVSLARKEPRRLRRAPEPRRREVVVRELRTVDGDALRALWADVGFRSLGDDDRSLARLARRNPGLVLVAADGGKVVGSALGAWDGRRGWLYHVATAKSHRRQGIATRLVEQIESGLAALGCPKVNVLLRAESDGGEAFWKRLGYASGTAAHMGKELEAS